MPKVRDSRFWEPLLQRYPRSPSIALCRVPEVEYLASIELQPPVVDHCCGDGYIAQLCFPGVRIDIGLDISEPRLAVARTRGIYGRTLRNDLGKGIGLENASVGTVFNNSGIEHIDDLDGAIAEISRILRPGGKVYFTILNSRYFDWWPASEQAMQEYREYQPFYHALDEHGWTEVLARHGLRDVGFRDYFPQRTAELLAEYDFRYSEFYIRRRLSIAVGATVVAPPSLLRPRWRRIFGDLEWMAPSGQGAGFMVSAVRTSQ